jgi:hypothetical protein
VNSNEQYAVQIRASLSHPVIDSNGHWIEYGSGPYELRNVVTANAVRFLDADSRTLLSGSGVAKEAQSILATLSE